MHCENTTPRYSTSQTSQSARDSRDSASASLSSTRPGYAFRTCTTIPGVGRSGSSQLRPFEAEVRVLPLDGGLATMLGRAYEIGHAGVFVHSAATLPVGTLVLLQITSDLGVARFTAKVVQSVQRFGLGCTFVDLDDTQRAVLSFMVSVASSAPDEARTIPADLPTVRINRAALVA